MLSTLAAIFTHMSMCLMMNFSEVWQLRLVAEKHLDNSNTNEYEWVWGKSDNGQRLSYI